MVKRPVMRYHGGKWRLAPWIIQHLPPHLVYVEPFGGGASVLLRKPRSHGEVYNDLDDEVVNLFRILRDPTMAEQLIRLLELTPFARTEWLAARSSTDNPVENARRLIVRSMMGHGSAAYNTKHSTGFRSNAKRRGSTPPRDWANKPAALLAVIERLRGVTIENRDAIALIAQHDGPDVLFYVDPPYVHETRRPRCNVGVRQTYRFEMTDDEHRHLAAKLRSVAGMVVVSGYPCPLYDEELFPDWHRVQTATHADGAVKKTECLWLNEAAERALSNGAGADLLEASR